MSNITIDIVGEEVVFDLLAKLPTEVQDAAIEEAYKYLLDVLRAYPPRRYITRVSAYGTPFFTDRQRKWFFAALNSGEIDVPYRRTQGLGRAWKKHGFGQNAMLVNPTPGAEYVMGEKQSRHEAMVGWKTTDQIVEEREARIMEKLEVGAEKALKKLGA